MAIGSPSSGSEFIAPGAIVLPSFGTLVLGAAAIALIFYGSRTLFRKIGVIG